MIRKLHTCFSAGLLLLSLAILARPAGAQTLSVTADSVAFFAPQGRNPANQYIYINPGADADHQSHHR
jgi:hypothetical protein